VCASEYPSEGMTLGKRIEELVRAEPDLPPKQIAQKLGISYKKHKRYIWNKRTKLRKYLFGKGEN
jgi:DNA-directed RNA polymerase specialized sigma24 family protein